MVSLVAWLSEYGPKIQTLSQALDSTLTRLTKVLPDDWNCRVISSDSSEVGGLAHYLGRLTTYLAARGHDVHVFWTDHAPSRSFEFRGVHVHRLCIRVTGDKNGTGDTRPLSSLRSTGTKERTLTL